MRRKAEYRIGVGASSILMILVALALAALALLSLYAAKNNAALCRRNVEMAEAYYRAASDTQYIVAAIAESLTPEALSRQTALRSFVTYRDNRRVWVDLRSNRTFAFEVDAGADRTLQTEGVVEADSTVTLTRHTLVSAPSATQTPLPVYQP
jgi:hypothetical protein